MRKTTEQVDTPPGRPGFDPRAQDMARIRLALETAGRELTVLRDLGMHPTISEDGTHLLIDEVPRARSTSGKALRRAGCGGVGMSVAEALRLAAVLRRLDELGVDGFDRVRADLAAADRLEAAIEARAVAAETTEREMVDRLALAAARTSTTWRSSSPARCPAWPTSPSARSPSAGTGARRSAGRGGVRGAHGARPGGRRRGRRRRGRRRGAGRRAGPGRASDAAADATGRLVVRRLTGASRSGPTHPWVTQPAGRADRPGRCGGG